jgi:hypothetical protein
MRAKAGVPFSLLLVAACNTITEELPTRPPDGGTTPIVYQIPAPPPAPAAVPTSLPAPLPPLPPLPPVPVPAPVPQRTATPPPSGGGNAGAAPNQVGVGVTSYLRNGRLVSGGAASYKPGDVLYLTCTPKGPDNRPTDNHGPIEGWNVWSNNLGQDSEWRVTSTETFNPDVHVSSESGTGEIQAYCQVNGIRSNTLVMRIIR